LDELSLRDADFYEGQKSVITMVQYFLELFSNLGKVEFIHMIETKIEKYVARILKNGAA
jgi:hypothetical protein